MKSLGLSLVLIVIWCGCSRQSPTVSPPVALPPRLEAYFERYCGDTDSLGIGFVAWHTYDYRFRQRLKQTQDPELKRLYVLLNLHQNVEWSLRDFEAGIIKTGKTSSRPLTLPEWQTTRQRIMEQIEDLATYSAFTNFVTVSRDASRDLFDRPDPALEQRWIKALRLKVGSITNSTSSATGSRRRP